MNSFWTSKLIRNNLDILSSANMIRYQSQSMPILNKSYSTVLFLEESIEL